MKLLFAMLAAMTVLTGCVGFVPPAPYPEVAVYGAAPVYPVYPAYGATVVYPAYGGYRGGYRGGYYGGGHGYRRGYH